ncbi:shikimate dehydrogenase [Microbacterium sp. SORGH_AS_0888]|uniref:shikimate dehydrogenase n=1 Tax=Microbacterium sp. SORGH_AS_0888 TaxID=3041791 RepID=UPI002782E807|nr:shikimate dehydrogenase [Microbacterium sp. SORGH_AS_0888]MDQ1128527.1 shikimate dehydrogenase [Microbacterium sp. SORGH_AS_0888]
MSDRPYLVGLVGTGVTPSLTPPMHMAEATALGLPYVYRPIDMSVIGLGVERIGEILDWAERLGFDALNITHPCKQAVIPYLDRIDPVAQELGAVNTVLLGDGGRRGHNTDTTGFESGFRAGMDGADLTRVVQLGAGGAGAAVGAALLRLGAGALTIVDVDQSRARALAADLAHRHDRQVTAATPLELPTILAEASGLVHCTPTGMAEHPGLPLPAALLRSDLWVADIVYRPYVTELLATARALGARTLDGGRMAVFQAVDAFELITGVRPDPDRMTQHFHTLVADHEILV